MPTPDGNHDNNARISVVINTRNAREFLQQVLDSVKMFDEVIVVDMESDDDTVDIAHRAGVRVLTFPRNGANVCEAAREFAIHQATYRFVLVVDADEVVTPELRQYLYRLADSDDCPAGLLIPRQNRFMNQLSRTAPRDYLLRFFDHTVTLWPPVIHALPQVAGRVDRVPKSLPDARLLHLSPSNVADVLERTNRYTDHEVPKRAGKHYGIASLLFRPPLFAFKRYVLQGTWRDGLPGLLDALTFGNYQFCMIAKILEARWHQRKKQ